MGVSNMVGAWKRHRESEVGGLSDGKQSCDAESPLSFAGYYALPPLLGSFEIVQQLQENWILIIVLMCMPTYP